MVDVFQRFHLISPGLRWSTLFDLAAFRISRTAAARRSWSFGDGSLDFGLILVATVERGGRLVIDL
jgi:hypothetical protein